MKKWNVLLLTVLAFVMIFSLCACSDNSQGTTEVPEDPNAAPVITTDTVLYFNVDRELYDGMNEESGLTSRPKGDDKFYHFLMGADGKGVDLKVKSLVMANNLETNYVVGLKIDADGVVTDIYSVKDMGGKVAANRYFFTSQEGNQVVVNTNNTNSGDEITLTLADGAKIYDVSNKEENFCASAIMEDMDELYAVAGADGKVTHIWIMSKASQRAGRAGCICGANETGPHKEGCDGSMLTYWQPWTNPYGMPDKNGYWYLDVEGGVIMMTERNTVRINADIFIDLNGHTVVPPANQPMYFCPDAAVGINITMLDSVGTAIVRVPGSATPESIQARLVTMIGDKHSFTLYGGTLDGTALLGNGGGNGGLLRILNGAALNIHGGKLIAPQGKTNTGSVIFCSGVFTMTGGTITGGSAKKGGNVFMGTYVDSYTGTTYYSEFHMSGGEIINGTAEISGGNMCYYEDGVFEHTGGTISGGSAPSDPDIYMYPKFDPAA